MEQWFVRVNKPFALRQNTLGIWKKGDKVTLKELMREAVAVGEAKQERVKMVPARFEKTYSHWINNLRDWCISRQIWFGHRIPVWYKEGEEQRISQQSPGDGWEQDPDTLDTWFSAGMWTFSTLGWPDAASVDADGNIVKTGDLALYHPTSVLETGYDILFFWVARMILMSTYALGEVPFKDVYLHGLVRDDQGRKMSKSLDNILDPLELIPKYGTDAVRLSVIVGSTPGQDIKLAEDKIESLKHFTNKLWNISRFVIGKVGETDWLTQDHSAEEVQGFAKTVADRWILGSLQTLIGQQKDFMQAYRLSQAAEALSDFTWTVFADWYIEIAKVEGEKTEILAYVLRTLLKLWHPFMPFVTEAIWQAANMGGNLVLASYPAEASSMSTEPDVTQMERLRALVTDGRRLRAEGKLDATKKFAFQCIAADEIWSEVQENTTWIMRMLGASSLERVESFPAGMMSAPTGASLIGIVQEAASGDEKARLQGELEAAEAYREDLKRRLANTEFVSKAPEKVVKDIESKLADTEMKIVRLQGQLAA
jgi:valyl-tRNA synthetase